MVSKPHLAYRHRVIIGIAVFSVLYTCLMYFGYIAL